MIDKPYLLVMTLPCYVDAEGRRYAEELWHKDLVEHLSQIADLTLAAPLHHQFPDRKVIEIDTSLYEGNIRFVDLPECRSTFRALVSLPKITWQLWKAIGRAEIVHANTGGWPISLGWVTIPLARLRRRFVLTVVESGGWRMGLKPPWRFKPLVQGVVFESMARVIVNLSDFVAFTHSGYRDSLMLPIRRHRGHIICASWIDRENILSRDRADALWAGKLADPGRPLRIVFAANLQTSKGLLVLLEAMKELDRRGVAVELDIYGRGDLEGACVEASTALTRVKITIRGMLAYGEPFFAMLEEHDLMVVPSLSDEQPRVIYDCFARALPVIASKTPGVIECATDGLNARLVNIGDPIALADAIEWASGHREAVWRKGSRAST